MCYNHTGRQTVGTEVHVRSTSYRVRFRYRLPRLRAIKITIDDYELDT